MSTKAATPWGSATVVEELRLQQRAGDKRFSSIVQLLEDARGERLVRFAYATDGTARRGPVTLRARDLAKLRTALADTPELAAALGLGLGECEGPVVCGVEHRAEDQGAVGGAEQRPRPRARGGASGP